MNRRSIRIIIVFATLSLIGVVATQIYWVNKAFDLQEKQFNQRVHIALTNVTNEILTLNGDSSEVYEPIKQMGSNSFIASINDTLHPYFLESLLMSEFKQRNIHSDFEYVIYDCFTDSIVYGNYVTFDNSGGKSAPTRIGKWERDGHYFGVHFPNKTGYLVNQMGIWLFSSVIMLIVIIYFAYTTSVILKQKRLSEIKTDFINNLTHEFKTPISTISLSSEVLLNEEQSLDKERLRNYAQIIKQENNRLKIQVEKVLQLSTFDKSGIELDLETHDIHKIICDSIKSFNLILDDKKGKINVDLNAAKFNVMADKLHISNVFYNLVDNAIKYAQNEPPKVDIRSFNEDGKLVVEIEDNGIGMSSNETKQIFDKFYRVPHGDLHNVKGFGLGLSYVKSIVELHHGSISVKSQLEKGSTFIIKLPLNL